MDMAMRPPPLFEHNLLWSLITLRHISWPRSHWEIDGVF
jgi:hypothetical protein